MHRVTPLFDEYFRPEKRGNNLDDDMVFAGAFLHQVVLIVKERAGVVLDVGAEDCTRILKDFDATARTIRQMLAD